MIKDEDDISTEECECGAKKYGYYADNGIIFICFKCGRFMTSDFGEHLVDIFLNDPQILLSLIKGKYFKPLSDISDLDE